MRRSTLTIVLSLFLIASAVLALSFTAPDEGEGGYATMNIYENFSIVNSMIVITYPDESTEVIDLGPFKYNAEYLQENGKTITRTLNRFYREGYRVITTSSSGKINSSKAMRITTVILEKNR